MIKLLKRFTIKEWLFILLTFWLIYSQVWLELKMPDYMSKITILVQTEGSKMREILTNGGYMVLCALGSLIIAFFTGYIVSKISAKFSLKIRKEIFNKVVDLSIGDVKNFSTSSLITRTTNDVTQIEMLISMGMQLLIKAPITVIWAIIKIINKSWQWSAITAASIVILLTIMGVLVSLVLPRFKIVQKLTDELNKVTRENLSGIRVVRAFNAEKYQKNRFDNVNNNLTRTQLFNQKAFALISPVMYSVMYFLTLSIYYVGANLINKSMLADKIYLFGDMIVFSSYAVQVIMSFLMLAFMFMILPRAQVSAKRINEVLDSTITIKNGNIDKNITGQQGTVEFKNVSFKYPDAEEYLLRNITFKVDKGQTVAFVGSTGSGKSTLVNLIPRFYDTTEGTILINGVNVKEYKDEYLHSIISYIPQKPVIFSGSINYNVGYGDNLKSKIKKTDLEQAIRVAQAEDFVLKMVNKYNTHVAQSGTNISGGQKQRLAIARAIAKKPEIYIFDDSFSALDYKTDALLRGELKKYTKNATSLIVAQRIGTVMNADKIIVLDNGKCVGIGTHGELLKTCKIYKQIALSQLSKEELKNA